MKTPENREGDVANIAQNNVADSASGIASGPVTDIETTIRAEIADPKAGAEKPVDEYGPRTVCGSGMCSFRKISTDAYARNVDAQRARQVVDLAARIVKDIIEDKSIKMAARPSAFYDKFISGCAAVGLTAVGNTGYGGCFGVFTAESPEKVMIVADPWNGPMAGRWLGNYDPTAGGFAMTTKVGLYIGKDWEKFNPFKTSHPLMVNADPYSPPELTFYNTSGELLAAAEKELEANQPPDHEPLSTQTVEEYTQGELKLLRAGIGKLGLLEELAQARSNIIAGVKKFLAENPTRTKEEFAAFLKEVSVVLNERADQLRQPVTAPVPESNEPQRSDVERACDVLLQNPKAHILISGTGKLINVRDAETRGQIDAWYDTTQQRLVQLKDPEAARFLDSREAALMTSKHQLRTGTLKGRQVLILDIKVRGRPGNKFLEDIRDGCHLTCGLSFSSSAELRDILGDELFAALFTGGNIPQKTTELLNLLLKKLVPDYYKSLVG